MRRKSWWGRLRWRLRSRGVRGKRREDELEKAIGWMFIVAVIVAMYAAAIGQVEVYLSSVIAIGVALIMLAAMQVQGKERKAHEKATEKLLREIRDELRVR